MYPELSIRELQAHQRKGEQCRSASQADLEGAKDAGQLGQLDGFINL